MNDSVLERPPFRFGVVAAPRSGATWRDTARRVEDLGYASLLVPDGPTQLSPLPALAVAAGATTRLRVGTWVLAAPLRAPRAAAWDVHTLAVLSGGRFELGIGTGLPAAGQQARDLGRPASAGDHRLRQVVETLDAVATLDGDVHTPVLMAVAGPKAIALAAARADAVAFALPATAGVADVDARVEALRSAAGDRVGDLELVDALLAVGDDLPPWIEHATGSTPDQLRASGAQGWLRGTPDEVADALVRRRERWGTSYVTVPEHHATWFAPVVARLSGR